MLVKEIRTIAQDLGLSAGKLKKDKLIRAIQTQEGNHPCFKTRGNSCDQNGCLWRNDCLKQKQMPTGHLFFLSSPPQNTRFRVILLIQKRLYGFCVEQGPIISRNQDKMGYALRRVPLLSKGVILWHIYSEEVQENIYGASAHRSINLNLKDILIPLKLITSQMTLRT